MSTAKNANEEIFKEPRTFISNGETLSLREIKKRKIISVTIECHPAEPQKTSRLRKMLGMKEKVQDKKTVTVTITDPQGIDLEFMEGIEPAMICFWSKEMFNRFSAGKYDEDTIYGRYVFTPVRPYRIHFHIDNLQKIEWIGKE